MELLPEHSIGNNAWTRLRCAKSPAFNKIFVFSYSLCNNILKKINFTNIVLIDIVLLHQNNIDPYLCEFEFCPWRGALDTTLCDKVCQWLAADLSPVTPVFSTNKSDPPPYNWNIVERSIKHHNSNPNL